MVLKIFYLFMHQQKSRQQANGNSPFKRVLRHSLKPLARQRCKMYHNFYFKFPQWHLRPTYMHRPYLDLSWFYNINVSVFCIITVSSVLYRLLDLLLYVEFCDGTCKDYQRVYELTAPTPTVKYPRTPGYRDTQDDSWFVSIYWSTCTSTSHTWI